MIIPGDTLGLVLPLVPVMRQILVNAYELNPMRP
jgi:hypothetical protein